MSEVKFLPKAYKWVLFLFCLTLTMLTGRAYASPTMSVEQVKPGMIGIARTVIQGNKIVDFKVKIIGVVNNNMQDMIMAKAYGPVVDDTNGIIHGMSGSPVYVDGKIIGAVARAISSDTTPYMFYITPIDEMTALWQLPDNLNKDKLPQVKIDLQNNKSESIDKEIAKIRSAYLKTLPSQQKELSAGKGSSKKQIIANKRIDNGKQLGEKTKKNTLLRDYVLPGMNMAESSPLTGTTPLFATGFSENSRQFLASKLAPFSLEPTSLAVNDVDSQGGSIIGTANLQPGSSVGAAVTYGDFIIGAVGTVTDREGNKIVAFGHPFTYRGNVNYFMVNADIVGSVKGILNGVKVASIGKIIGRINQDRYAGITGILGEYPAVVPMKVAVFDKNLQQRNIYSTSIAYNEELVPNLATSIAYASLNQSIDRLGGGTARVKFTIHTDAVPSGIITRSNMFYNPQDVGQFAVSELGTVLGLITTDAQKQRTIMGIDVDMNYDTNPQVASILRATTSSLKVVRGEKINVVVTYKPYRGKAREVLIPYIIPAEQPLGDMVLEVRGGGLIPVRDLLQGNIDTSAEEDKEQTTADKIAQFLDRPMNNDILVEAGTNIAENDKEQKEAIEAAVKFQQKLVAMGKQGKRVLPKPAVATTDYIIDNVIRIHLNVVRKK